MKISDTIKIKELEKYIKKEFGKKCPEYSFGCYNCSTQRLLEDIKDWVAFCESCEKDENV